MRSDRGAEIDPAVSAMDGVAAPPRRNGELVFEAPWQGRAFGLALVLVESLGLQWNDFQRHLIAAIGEAPDTPYYESWVEALERLLGEHGVAVDELEHAAKPVRREQDK
jgi:nitrile hydratase accessory protein